MCVVGRGAGERPVRTGRSPTPVGLIALSWTLYLPGIAGLGHAFPMLDVLAIDADVAQRC